MNSHGMLKLSVIDGIVANSERLNDLSGKSGHPANAHWRPNTLRAFICGLLSPRGPTAVLLGVWAVIVFPLQSQAVRPFPHVSEEVIKLKPIVANVYPAPTVTMVGRIFWIGASLHHASPCDVFRASSHPMGHPLPAGISLVAPAAFRVTAKQIIPLNEHEHPTITRAPDALSAIYDFLLLNNQQARESFTQHPRIYLNS